MSKLLAIVAACIALLLICTACPKPQTGAGAGNPAGADEPVGADEPTAADYTATDSGRTITLQPGDTFTVELTSSPTTAYFWEVIELDEAVVRNVSSEYVPDPATKDMAGGGGVDIWTFEALASGTTALRMEYARKFEPRDPAGEFELTLVVSGG